MEIIGFPHATWNYKSDLRKTEWLMESLVDYGCQKIQKTVGALYNRDRIIFIHEMLWFMPVPPLIRDGHIW